MTPEEIQKLRALETLKVLWELLAVAQKHADVVTWINEGGPEAEDFLDAIESGRPHPLLRLWEERKSTAAANRAAPSRRDRHARRLIVLGCMALERTGLGKLSARKRLARAVRGVFASPPSAVVLEHWQRNLSPPLSEADERVVAGVVARHGSNRAEIVRHFAGLAQIALSPLPQLRRVTTAR